jgi:hypothetical protein
MIIEMTRTYDFETSYATIGLTNRAYISFLGLLPLDRPTEDCGMEIYARQLRAGTMTHGDVASGLIGAMAFKSRPPLSAKTSRCEPRVSKES